MLRVLTGPLSLPLRYLRALLGLAALSLLTATALAAAQVAPDLVTQRALWVDASGTASIAEVPGQPFRIIQGPVSRGYTPSATWLRIEVAPSALPELVMVVQAPYLDDVRLHSPRPGGGWSVQQLGDRFAFAERPRQEVNFAFPLRPDAAQASTHYLRVQTRSATLVHVRVLSADASRAYDGLLHGALGVYLGLVFVLMCVSLVCWALTRDHLWGFDGLFQFWTLSYAVVMTGFAAKYLLPDMPALADLGVSVMSATQLTVASLFFLMLFRAYGAPRWVQAPYLLAMLALPPLMVLVAQGQVQTAMSLNANLTLLHTLAGAIVVWFVPVRDKVTRYLLRAAYLLTVAYILVYIVPLLGLAPMSEVNLYPPLLANLLSAVMLQAVMVRRAQLLLREKWQLERKIFSVEERLQREIARQAGASGFTTLLMQELKVPLGSIRDSARSLASGFGSDPPERGERLRNIEKSVEGIDAALQRCIDWSQQGLETQRGLHDLPQLLTQWIGEARERERIRLSAPPQLPARIDAALLRMMVRTLLGNALLYSPPGSIVFVALTEWRQQASEGVDGFDGFVIEVRNYIGAAGAPDPERVFGKHYRAPGALSVPGIGLGLHWLHGVAQILGGLVHYRQLNQQVVFELWLPR